MPESPKSPSPAPLAPPDTAPKNPLIPSYRQRHDGWTLARTKTFLATLRQTGCVADAARVTGVSARSGYRLRQKDADFREAWDDALADARRGLLAIAHERAVVGRETIIIRGGEEVERRIQPSDAMLALLIKQGELGGNIGNPGADPGAQPHDDKVITLEEWEAGFRFDGNGRKHDDTESAADVRARIDAKLNMMRANLERRRARSQEETGERRINIRTGEGVTAEIIAAVRGFGRDEGKSSGPF